MDTHMELDLGAQSEEQGPKEQIDARPALPVSEQSLWQRAAEKRDEIATLIDSEFKKENIIAWIRKSKPGEYPLYLVVDSWRQISETELIATFDRSSLKITISVAPYLKNHLTYKVELKRHGREFSYEHWVLSSEEIAELARYLIKGGRKPHFFEPRVSAIARFFGAFIPFIGKPPKNELIHEARPNHWTLANFLGWGGILVLVIAVFGIVEETSNYYANNTNIYILTAFVGLTALAAALFIWRRRPNLDAIPKQSLRTPRREFLVDSWHVSVPDAGEQFDQFRRRLYNAVIGNDPSIEANYELHQNLTPRGFEERERLVLTKGQATLHIHIYPFSKDAFVGWESYLNWNRWGEGDTVSTTIRKDGSRVTYRSLDVGVHMPNDFDLIEADVLAETVHRVLVSEVKAFLKEREIEADLDFKIIRGDRARALTEGKEDDGGDKGKGKGKWGN